MTLVQAIILGAVQGLTEFFPISSSGHLVVIQKLFAIKEPMIAFDVFLHIGSLVAVLIYFRRDIITIITKDRKTALYLVAATIPTVVIALMFKDAVEELFVRPHLVGYMFLITGGLLIAASFYIRIMKGKTPGKIGFVNSLIIGTAQGIAVIPGISRSGATITSAIMAGVDKDEAPRFSFLLSIPIIIGAALLESRKIAGSLRSVECLYFVAGGITAMLVGLFSISVLIKMVKGNMLYLFGIYCIVLASVLIVLL